MTKLTTGMILILAACLMTALPPPKAFESPGYDDLQETVTRFTRGYNDFANKIDWSTVPDSVGEFAQYLTQRSKMITERHKATGLKARITKDITTIISPVSIAKKQIIKAEQYVENLYTNRSDIGTILITYMLEVSRLDNGKYVVTNALSDLSSDYLFLKEPDQDFISIKEYKFPQRVSDLAKVVADEGKNLEKELANMHKPLTDSLLSLRG